MSNQNLATRHSVRELQQMRENGNPQPLDNLVRAWKGIKDLDYKDPKSFFMLGGFHGEPFEGPDQSKKGYWGGYCNHANVLFPTWHRVYVLEVEQALQSIVPGVMLPYWDETSELSKTLGIPTVLTDENYMFADGTQISNPLKSFIFPVDVVDTMWGDNGLYTKPAGYETVRYPLSGLVGTPDAATATAAHNAKFPNYDQQQVYLNTNIVDWLKGTDSSTINITSLFESCLDAPNYTAFSNTSSAGAWNAQNSGKTVVPLESPHNDIHLAVGGFDLKGQKGFDNIPGANGDMGENNTAGLDPIFFFHHCNVDRMFWLWQVKNGHTDSIEIIEGFQGSNTTDPNGQGPAAGQTENENLTLETPLTPFMKGPEQPYISNDVINIETQLGITYSPGSLSEVAVVKSAKMAITKKLQVSGINREQIRGSFIIHAYADVNGQEIYLGRQSVLSRWNVANCENCQKNLDVLTFFDLSDKLTEEEIKHAVFHIKIQGRPHGDNSKRLAKTAYQLKVVD